MSEIHKGGAEKKTSSIEGIDSLREQALKRRAEQLEKRSIENNADKSGENARREALELAANRERQDRTRNERNEQNAARERVNHIATKAERKKAYENVMNEARSQMSASARTFSRVIHNPIVEKTSEVVGATVARPNAILAGSVSALILVLGVYSVARFFGYPLSGFETIGAFIIGWIIGIVYDFLHTMVTGKVN